jgi:putative hydrolase of the HAD superfamily
MELPRPRALLVDFYGTLAHGPTFTLDGGTGIVVGSLQQDGIDVPREAFDGAYRAAVKPYMEVMRRGVETHNTSWVADALRAMGVDVAPTDPRVVRAVRRYFEAYADCMEALPGADASLRRLAERFPVVLVSNFTDALPVRAALDRLAWSRLFRGILISADIGIRKPHPDIFLKALEAAGVAAGEAIFVGDDLEEDVAGAQGCGIPVVHVRRAMLAPLRSLRRPAEEGIVPDWAIDAFEELPALLGIDGG